MRVVVAGAGIGGLALAQGLRRHGIEVVVLEPDTDLGRTSGYKLHLGVPAAAALRELLDPRGVERLLASSVGTRGFALDVRDHRGRRLLTAREAADGLTLDVDRATLRTVLADGLDDALRTGVRCTGWEAGPDGVVVRTGDAHALEADLLVVADGVRSPLAEELAGRPTSAPTGFAGAAGRTPWSALPSPATRLLDRRPVLAVGPGGVGLFASRHDPRGSAAVDVPGATAAVTTDPVVIWGLIALEDHLDRSAAPGQALLDRVRALLDERRWAPALVDVVRAGEPGSTSVFTLHAADPDDLAPWAAGRVTALGDAVHAMPPTGGQGAATAVLDAHCLAGHLAAAAAGRCTVPVAVHDHEAAMRVRARPAVRESLQPLGWIRAAGTPAGSVAVRALTPVLAGAAGAWRRASRR